MKVKNHIILPSGLHAIQDSNNHVHIYTEDEYQELNWWASVKLKFNLI